MTEFPSMDYRSHLFEGENASITATYILFQTDRGSQHRIGVKGAHSGSEANSMEVRDR
jgi:hypothetical protein